MKPRPLTREDMDCLSYLAVRNDKTGRWESEPLCVSLEPDAAEPERVQRLLALGLVATADGWYKQRNPTAFQIWFSAHYQHALRKPSVMLSLTAKGLALVQKVFG